MFASIPKKEITPESPVASQIFTQHFYQDVNKPITPHQLATYGGETEVRNIRNTVARYEREANVDDGDTVLHEAVRKNDRIAVQYLVEELSLSTNEPNWNYDTPLHVAATLGKRKFSRIFLTSTGEMEIAQYLVEHGADVNTWNRDGDSPVHLAATCGHDTTVSRLLELNADVNARNYSAETPLFGAVRNNHQTVIDILLAWNIDVNAFRYFWFNY